MMIKTFDNLVGSGDLYIKVLGTIAGDVRGKNVIDLCCCSSPHLRKLPFAKKVYVDVVDRGLNCPIEQQSFVLADVLGDHPVLNDHYDVATCLDGIEHLTPDQGWQLLARMEKLADKQILFTPLDPWMMDTASTNPESHKSLWTPDILPGYAHIVFPKYHKLLNIGAFFFWKCDNLEADFERVVNALNF